MSLDNGETWTPSRIYHPLSDYHTIAGTHWLSDDSWGLARPQGTTLFRVGFHLPTDLQDASLALSVLADNVATVSLNGSVIGVQAPLSTAENFQLPADAFVATGPFVSGTNVLQFSVKNLGTFMGLNYRAVVTYTVNTAPQLQVPADMTVDATSPAGAAVTFPATATDDHDPNPSIVCTPPSGSTFAIGTTTVTCVARDERGLTSTPGTFRVTVRGAGALAGDLAAAVDGIGPGGSLAAKAKGITAAISDGNVPVACNRLAGFIAEVGAQSGKAIPEATAAGLAADATQLRAVLGCG